jgi:hypothetical protein
MREHGRVHNGMVPVGVLVVAPLSLENEEGADERALLVQGERSHVFPEYHYNLKMQGVFPAMQV